MANTQNLKRNLSPSEARENGKKGGIASGIARRKKREIKECCEILFNLAVNEKLDSHLKDLNEEEHSRINLKDLNVPEQDRTNLMAIIARLTVQAQEGDVQSAKLLLKVAGALDDSSTVNVHNTHTQSVFLVPPQEAEE